MKQLLMILLCGPMLAQAKTIFEPSLGLSRGAFEGAIAGSGSLTNGTNVEATYTTFNLGFRYGITRRYIHVTAVAEGYLTSISGVSAFTTDGSGNRTFINTSGEDGFEFLGNVGVGIGYEWNIPIRTYVILGFPFSGLELSYFVSETFLLGFKYTRMADVDFAGANLEVNTFGVAVSFPIEFDYPSHWWRKTDWQ